MPVPRAGEKPYPRALTAQKRTARQHSISSAAQAFEGRRSSEYPPHRHDNPIRTP